MTVAILNICFDPRLSHDLIRSQAKSLLEAQGLKADRIFITSDAGGNFGSGLRNAIDLLGPSEGISMIALLDHDSCQAASAGVREPIPERLAAVSSYLQAKGLKCTIATGSIVTDANLVHWSD